MLKGYIEKANSLIQFQKIVAAINEFGVINENISVNKQFDDFVKTVESGDTIVVYSLDFFCSLSDLIKTSVDLDGRGINMVSLTESWYGVTPEIIAMFNGLIDFDKRIRIMRTMDGLVKAKANGKRLGRPVGTTKLADKIVAVTKLRDELSISVVKACEIADCNPRSYYRYIKKTKTNL